MVMRDGRVWDTQRSDGRECVVVDVETYMKLAASRPDVIKHGDYTATGRRTVRKDPPHPHPCPAPPPGNTGLVRRVCVCWRQTERFRCANRGCEKLGGKRCGRYKTTR
jgi:hypothetical protein